MLKLGSKYSQMHVEIERRRTDRSSLNLSCRNVGRREGYASNLYRLPRFLTLVVNFWVKSDTLVPCPSISILANIIVDFPAAKEAKSGRWSSENGNQT